MFSRVDLEGRLAERRNRRLKEAQILEEVYQIFGDTDLERNDIADVLTKRPSEDINSFQLESLETHRIYHLSDIQDICVDYRLRFLSSHYFKGGFPEEAISEIRRLEKQHEVSLKNFKIMAPAKLLKLENADDPLLFAPMGNDYYYLIHKWGHDLHPLRKLMMWPFKCMDNLAITVVALSILLTLMLPMHWFVSSPNIGNYIFLFLFVLKGLSGIILFYGISLGKNFNRDIWNSKYYNG